MEPGPGQAIGDYEIVARLGAGGLGVVYEVKHLISQRHEAMKIMQADQSGTPEMVERFRREVQTLAALNHVNIAALHTAFYYENQLAMIMELIQGETLRNLRLKTSITLSQTLDYIAQVLLALTYAHHLGVVHRDIKPQNIMITVDNVVKLLDFGIALTARSADLTQSGQLLGSVNYISPEQVSGGKATPQSDIYSLGVVLYESLTGRLPITGSTVYEVMMAHVQNVPAPPCEIAPGLPRALSDITVRALAKDPAQRFPSAADFLHAIQAQAAVHTCNTQVTLPAAQPVAVPLRASTGSAQHKSPSQSDLQALPLEEITRKLAVYIGPVAKFVVKKLAAQFDDSDSIYREAARQITSATDRAAFLRSKRQ
ncbi:MAG: serine/threonine-protein kinase [Acidobacteriaceae bacterium]